ncbi:cyclic peptide export ABC transporter [Burkholderia sp. Ax-1719]|uniref:cyclic peptide export ABC transporter n=1 Tax=Burkholderia sp. Ax-1719 TaxID=2608334 RepID=UPI0014217882|nr:cyclic peptide export ABC transporter [Burkholderia sp. Ax-1719]NIE65694.1 cyclic peptide export ABC transporter [Burkholderia sp. Ax-1719]
MSDTKHDGAARAAQASPALHVMRDALRLIGRFWPLTLFATVMGCIGGFSTAWLLAAVNDGLHEAGGVSERTAWSFVGLCVLTVGGNLVAGLANSVVGQKVIAALRKDISSRIVCAPLAAIENYRVHRLLATLNGDIDTISAFTFNFSSYAIALALTLGCIVYLLVLSPVLFGLAAFAIFAGLLMARWARRGWNRYYDKVRDAQDDLQKQYRSITEGAKELRMNRGRRRRVFAAQLGGAVDLIASLKTRAMSLFWVHESTSSVLFFVVIGLMVVLQHRLGVASSVVSGFVITLLYVKGPVQQLSSALPALGQAQVSFKRIAELSAEFRNNEPDLLIDAPDAPLPAFESLALRHASYAFPAPSGARGFALGPVDLEVKRGEIVFIVGENGCGKTTLIKLLLGLYAPQEGELLLNGQPVTHEGADAYRQLFSAVFADYFLFDDFVSDDAANMQLARDALARLEIAHKVSVENGAFTTTDLSTGQRKRLALVQAMLEARPVIMLDEWAADQDPTFRRVFYRELLPELKRMGRTVIAISHDDRFFDAADRVVRVSDGHIVSITDGKQGGAVEEMRASAA